jgi:hypothetical protein
MFHELCANACSICIIGDNTPPPLGGFNRKSPTMDQGVQTSGGVVNNVRGQQRPSRGGSGGYRGGGDNRRYQQANSSRYSHDMRGRPPIRGNLKFCCVLCL